MRTRTPTSASRGRSAAATGSAFVGSYVGRRLMHKVTIAGIQTLVGVMLLVLAAALAAGALG